MDDKEATSSASEVDQVGKDQDENQAGDRPQSAGRPGQKVTVRPAEFSSIHAAGESPGTQSIDLILDVPLRVSVELGRATMTIKDILALGPGSVIELDKLAGEAVDIMVNDRLIARGEVVVVDENFGVKVTDIVSPAKRNVAIA